jgi:type II secretory ATPase GspE/PulE/Tfp pilus assembly ATPase PilB-like protein
MTSVSRSICSGSKIFSAVWSAKIWCRDCALTKHRDPAEHRRHQQLFESSKLRYINPQGCAHCTRGVKGQTLVAEVCPLLRAGDRAYTLIRQGALAELAEYMTLEVGVDSKHAVAADKIVEGLIDPIITARRIGYFDSEKTWNRSA